MIIEQRPFHSRNHFQNLYYDMLYFCKCLLGDKRRLNEKKFPNKEKLPDGRKYWLEVKGRHGWKARYIKEVNDNEETVKFYQEIYDETGNLVEVHEKFPLDKGHSKMKGV